MDKLRRRSKADGGKLAEERSGAGHNTTEKRAALLTGRRFSWGMLCSVEFVQRPQRQFLRRDELEQRVQRQQGRAPALVEHRERVSRKAESRGPLSKESISRRRGESAGVNTGLVKQGPREPASAAWRARRAVR